MNQINRQRSARWVIAFGTILEIDRNRHLCIPEKLKLVQTAPRTKKEKQHEQA